MKKSFLLFLYFLFLFSFSNAQNIIWDGKNNSINIGKNIEILEDKNGSFTIEDVKSKKFRALFVHSKQTILHFGFTESIYWLRFSLENNSNKDLSLEIAHAFLPTTNLYYYDKENNLIEMKGGYEVLMNEKLIKHHFQIFPLPKGEHEFYIRVLSNAHPLPIKIWEKETYKIKTSQQKLVYGFYIGFMFFVILTNIFFFFTLRNWLYLFYAFVVLIYVCYASMVMDGFVLYVFDDLDLMFWYLTIPTIGVTVQTIYCMLFLETKKYIPKLNKIFWGIIIYFAVYVFVKELMPITVVLAINTVHAMASFFIMGFVGVKVGQKGNQMGYYFAIAYFIYFLLVIVEAIYIQTGFPPYLILSHVAMATIIEAFLLSFLLSKRFEWEKEETEKSKNEMQEKLIETTKENARILKDQNVLLEKKVIERTEVLNETNEELNQINEELKTTVEEVEQQKSKINLANSKLQIIFKQVSKQKEKIEISHKHIKDSINYAKKIQDAILPSLDLFENNLSDYFIFFKPRDVVSGDFYWAKKINEHFIFVAADCTGHGVPGAFVSMLGISFLNEIVARKGLYQAGKILDILREEIKKSLKQNSESKRQEGMDIAFCALNTKTNVLQFAGANNPLYLFRNNEMIEYKGNKQPIGIYRKEKSFTNYEIQLEKEDKIYIFSDGFIDQFGGERNKKFMKKNFKKLLSEIQNENMNKQKQIINNTFENWKGNYKQIDDVLVMGVKI